jgi:hypothetical protein
MPPRGVLAPTLELFDLGVEVMRQNLRRQHPDASHQEISERLSAWLRTRPGATFGDIGSEQARPRRDA